MSPLGERGCKWVIEGSLAQGTYEQRLEGELKEDERGGKDSSSRDHTDKGVERNPLWLEGEIPVGMQEKASGTRLEPEFVTAH